MPVKIKICGLRAADDAQHAAQHGAHAIGLMFHPPSSRNLTLSEAAAIRASLPPFITSVAVLVNPAASFVHEMIEMVRPALLQFHGDEPEDFCASFNMPYIKCLRATSSQTIYQQGMEYPSAQALLLDTSPAPNAAYGGGGKTFDWGQIPQNLPKPVIIAGGLTPTNVQNLLRTHRPYAVDVSSGVERAPGIKDKKKIQAFIEAVQAMG